MTSGGDKLRQQPGKVAGRYGAAPRIVQPWKASPTREGGVVGNSDSGDTPIVITDAARSYQEELSERRKRYSIMMSLRLPCLVLAALFYNTPWLAAALIILSIPLPWIAVIIANDRLPTKRSTFRRYRGDRRELPSSTPHSVETPRHQVIETEPRRAPDAAGESPGSSGSRPPRSG